MAISSNMPKPIDGPATKRARSNANPESELKAALEVLETSIATPIVPGELATWLADLQHAWAEAAAQVHFHVKHLHPRQFEEIAEQDPELLPRIELLKAEDAAIEEERGKLNDRVVRLVEHAPQIEPDEEKVKSHLKGVIDDATALIVRVRKQTVALQTWYMEAFNRDRGAVD